MANKKHPRSRLEQAGDVLLALQSPPPINKSYLLRSANLDLKAVNRIIDLLLERGLMTDDFQLTERGNSVAETYKKLQELMRGPK